MGTASILGYESVLGSWFRARRFIPKPPRSVFI